MEKRVEKRVKMYGHFWKLIYGEMIFVSTGKLTHLNRYCYPKSISKNTTIENNNEMKHDGSIAESYRIQKRKDKIGPKIHRPWENRLG